MKGFAILVALTIFPVASISYYSYNCAIIHQSDPFSGSPLPYPPTTRACDTITGFYLYGWPVFSLMGLCLPAVKFYAYLTRRKIRQFILENYYT